MITGKIAIIAEAAAEFKSLYVCEKNEAMERVAVFMSVDCKMYLENWKSFQQLIPDKMTTEVVTGFN